MILGLSILTFTIVHVLISLVAIASGLIWLVAQARGTWLGGINTVFLVTTILTSVTGFLFPITTITPAIIFGVISLVILAISLAALGLYKRQGLWSRIYTGTAAFALYLNCFVLVVQSFLKLGPLQTLAPTQTEPPFAIAQGALLLLIVALGWFAVKRSAAPARIIA